ALLIVGPVPPPHATLYAGGWSGWLTALAAAAFAVRHFGLRPHQAGAVGTCLAGLGAAMLAACTAAHVDRGNWLAYSVLTAGCVAAGLLVLLRARRLLRDPALLDVAPGTHTPQTGWRLDASFGVIVALVAGLTVRAAFDPQAGAYWPALAMLAV